MQIDLLSMKLDEVELYYQLFSSESVCRFMDISPFQSVGDSSSFLDFSSQQRTNRKSFRHSIWVNGEFAGTTCLYSIYWHQKRASIGYALQECYWNKGIMGRALTMLEETAKSDFGINRLQATVLPDNLASKALLKKTGYIYEGLLHQYEIWDGKGFVDLEIYAKIL